MPSIGLLLVGGFHNGGWGLRLSLSVAARKDLSIMLFDAKRPFLYVARCRNFYIKIPMPGP